MLLLLLLLLLRRREELSSPLLAVATCVSRVLQIATYNKEIDNSGWARKWALFIPILPPFKMGFTPLHDALVKERVHHRTKLKC